MSQIDMLQRQIDGLLEKNARLGKEAVKHDEDAGRYREAAHRRSEQATRATNLSTASSHIRAAQTEEKKALASTKKAEDVRAKIAANGKQITSLGTRLRAAEEQERRSNARAADQQRRKAETHARTVRRLAAESKRDWDYLASRDGLRVLYLTANPYSIDRKFTSPDGSIVEENRWLHTEVEVREVQSAIRGSPFRGRIRVEHRPAATFDTLLDGLNDVRPHIIHFSGHAGGGELAFEKQDGRGAEAAVSINTLKMALGATDQRAGLVVLNACDSIDDARSLLEVVDVVIGMTSTIDDSSAITFAKRFYAAIASGQPIAHALGQAKAAMEASSMGDAELPTYACSDEAFFNEEILIEN